MSNIVERLAECEQITEWINPLDQRLVVATGELPPNGGAGLREDWEIGEIPAERLEVEVKRLVVPEAISLRGLVIATADIDNYGSRVLLNFTSKEDWSDCFPVGRDTAIFTDGNGKQAWAGVGVCGNILGLAVFSREIEANEIQANVQPVPKEVFEKIVSAA